MGLDLPGLSRKSIERRPYPPGVHGGSRRRKESVHGMQLKEKQKLRYNYGLSERQMRRLVLEARRSKSETGGKLLELMERRLDNVVFRAGYAPTIPAARQLVNHGHFRVNGRKVDIPSFRVKSGDVIKPREKSMKLASITESMDALRLARPEWLSTDGGSMETTVTSDPEGVPFDIEVQLVVEYYAKRL